MKLKRTLALLAAVWLLPWAGAGGEARIPSLAGHWVTTGISDGGTREDSGDLEVYFHDDGNALVYYRDYGVTAEEARWLCGYQQDAAGQWFEPYLLAYAWRWWGNAVIFEAAADPAGGAGWPGQDAGLFAGPSGTLRGGVLRLSFGFAEDLDPEADEFLLERVEGGDWE